MPAKKTKKKEKSWEDIGKTVGTKIEKEFKGKEKTWDKSWMCCAPKEGDGFLGRLIFIVGLLYALSYMGYLSGAPTWTLVVIVIGFALMKF